MRTTTGRIRTVVLLALLAGGLAAAGTGVVLRLRAQGSPEDGRYVWLAVYCTGSGGTVRARVDLDDPVDALLTVADYIEQHGRPIRTATNNHWWPVALLQVSTTTPAPPETAEALKRAAHPRHVSMTFTTTTGFQFLLQTQPEGFTWAELTTYGMPLSFPGEDEFSSLGAVRPELAAYFVEVWGKGDLFFTTTDDSDPYGTPPTAEALARRMAERRKRGFKAVPLQHSAEVLWPGQHLMRRPAPNGPALDFVLTVVASQETLTVTVQPGDPVGGLDELVDALVDRCDVSPPAEGSEPRLVACLQVVPAGTRPPEALRVRRDQGRLVLPVTYEKDCPNWIRPWFLRLEASGEWRWYPAHNVEYSGRQWSPSDFPGCPTLDHAVEFVPTLYEDAFEAVATGDDAAAWAEGTPSYDDRLVYVSDDSLNADSQLLLYRLRLRRLDRIRPAPPTTASP